jgi:predicted dithiol-disulfide oxidoreductase (DUF899 family)
MPMMNVFHRDGEVIRQFWAQSSSTRPPSPGRTPGISTPANAVFSLLDLTPQGR